MGDPRRLRKKYETPMHPWRRENLEEEKVLVKEFALKNKHELWKMRSALRAFKNQAKKLIAARGSQAARERVQLIQRLERLGLGRSDAPLEDILDLTVRGILERRLQSIAFRKGFARSMEQARQFIVHRHVTIAGKRVTAPSYLVQRAQEAVIQFASRSSLANAGHPERARPEQASPPPQAASEAPTPEAA